MNKSDRALLDRWWLLELLNVLEENRDLTIMLKHLPRQFFVCCEEFPKPNKRPHYAKIDFNGTLAPKYTREHGYTLLGERSWGELRVAVLLGTGHNL